MPNLCLQVSKTKGEKQAYIVRCEELDSALAKVAEGMPEPALQRKYADVVSRMAGMQMQHSNLAWQLEAVTASESLLQVRLSPAGTMQHSMCVLTISQTTVHVGLAGTVLS